MSDTRDDTWSPPPPAIDDWDEIWLEPKCCADPYIGRSWAPENLFECEDGVEATRYVRADRYDEALARIAKLEARERSHG